MRIEHIGDAVLYLGDCRDVLPQLGKVDAVVTDPPYGIAKVWKGGGGHGWGRAQDQTANRNEWDSEGPPETVLSWMLGTKSQIVWGGNYFNLPPSRCWLIWNKPERGFTLAEAEMAWTNFDSIVRVFDYPRSEPDRQHPTQKPLALMRWCVEKTKGVVCDPYMGSGTTGVACAKAARSFIGVERDEKWFDLSCRRIEAAYKQPDLFITRPEPPKQEAFNDL